MWVNNWTFNQTTVPAEVPWSQDRNLERPPTEFNVYGGKLSHVSAQHIGFISNFKITQTCIPRCIVPYDSTYCNQIEKKSNCLLVKDSVKTKR